MGSTIQPMQKRQHQAMAGIPLEGLPSDRMYSGMRVMQSHCGGMLRTSLRMLRTSLRMLRTSLRLTGWTAVHQLPLRGDLFLTIHCKTWQYSH